MISFERGTALYGYAAAHVPCLMSFICLLPLSAAAEAAVHGFTTKVSGGRSSVLLVDTGPDDLSLCLCALCLGETTRHHSHRQPRRGQEGQVGALYPANLNTTRLSFTFIVLGLILPTFRTLRAMAAVLRAVGVAWAVLGVRQHRRVSPRSSSSRRPSQSGGPPAFWQNEPARAQAQHDEGSLRLGRRELLGVRGASPTPFGFVPLRTASACPPACWILVPVACHLVGMYVMAPYGCQSSSLPPRP